MTATLQNIKEVGGISMSELKSYQQRCLKHNVKLALFRLCAAAGSLINPYLLSVAVCLFVIVEQSDFFINSKQAVNKAYLLLS